MYCKRRILFRESLESASKRPLYSVGNPPDNPVVLIYNIRIYLFNV